MRRVRSCGRHGGGGSESRPRVARKTGRGVCLYTRRLRSTLPPAPMCVRTAHRPRVAPVCMDRVVVYSSQRPKAAGPNHRLLAASHQRRQQIWIATAGTTRSGPDILDFPPHPHEVAQNKLLGNSANDPSDFLCATSLADAALLKAGSSCLVPHRTCNITWGSLASASPPGHPKPKSTPRPGGQTPPRRHPS